MQKRTQQMTLRRATDLRTHGAVGRRPMHRRLVVAAVDALLLIAVWTVARYAAGPGPGESP